MALTKIKEVDGYLKDETSGAVLSVDQNALDAYKRQRSQRNSIVSDINNIKQELGELDRTKGSPTSLRSIRLQIQ